MEDERAGILSRDAIINLKAYWRTVRFDYVAGDLIYRGTNAKVKASGTDTNWAVWKFTYDAGGDITLIEGPLTGTWDGRAALNWV